ncbi:hypothetical protein [Mycolicibacterium goodii]|uniref:Lipoprotein n=1 Tax=Mycolicibacterium goodii TaxID=134601 RepID=A0ABS6HLP5_MYCGD|nr:hypothetical protein [Mycolicibacterium goodii]MBU8810941.1 hypothetical protein [Mycolicibacterium goodii]MBU8823618.1 hypothetical protein [Mycolicibacterium goodii]MBU8835789.1 hypothetical protein [Mycolicibacterium goodii]
MGGFLRPRAVATGVAVMVVLSGCQPLGAHHGAERFVRPGSPRVSPSTIYTAAVDRGPVHDGVETWVAVIIDESGAEVFHDDHAFSAGHETDITWLSNEDQLWLLSREVGSAHVDRHPDGRWIKTTVSPDADSMPAEIRELFGA